MTEVVDLKVQIEKLKAAKEQVKTFQASIKESAVAQVKDIMETAGLTVTDLRDEASKGQKRGKRPAVYVDPTNPANTWSGTGRTPAWFNLANIDAYLIPGQQHTTGVLKKRVV